jgi:hypothetical protein
VVKIRSDRGGEFSTNILRSFLYDRGIIHAQSPAYTPQFQGKVERMNHTVGEMAHAMRVGANLDVRFWSLAWVTAVYLRNINRSPTSANQGMKIPYQMLFNKLPDLKGLYIFGSKAEAYIDEPLRKKGGNRSRPGIFVGYDGVGKAYRFLPAGETKWIPVRTLVCNEKDMVPGGKDEQSILIELQVNKKVGAQQQNGADFQV